jgi:HAE1 family hydrophobic/amphiphilic exporter-1
MYISEISIKKPVLATVLNLLIILTGIVAFIKLPVRGTPDVNPSVITIETYYVGASPAFMERNITSVIESGIKNIKNIDYISSTSSSGMSEITLFFKEGVHIESALNDVRSKVSDVIANLPPDIIPPVISKMDSDNWPSIWISASGNIDPMVLTDIVKQRVVPEFEKIESVSKCRVYSNYEFAIKIELDPIKLYQYKLSPLDIKSKIISQSKDYPAGVIRSETRNYVIKLEGTLDTAEEFQNIIIDPINFIKLRDIAKVSLSTLDSDSIIRYKGYETTTVGIIRDSKSNIIELSDSIIEILPKIQKSLPDSVKLYTAYDSGVPVKASINSVYKTAFEALILVLAIVYLFLGSISATIIPLVAIPISVIGSFALMQIFGFTINLYSLLGMILAIGLVVDDAIVMLENVYLHIENGLSPLEASFKAAKEIGFAILAMTFTLAAVFLPIGFIEGFVGQLFIEFAWTLAFCVMISGFVALTLSPMLSSKILISHSKKPDFILKFNSYLEILSAKYIETLKLVLSNSKIIMAIAGISLTILIASFYFVNKEFMPTEDASFMMISGEGQEGSNSKSNLDSIIQVEQILKNIPEVEGYFFNGYGNNAFGFIPLKKWHERSKSQIEIVTQVNALMKDIPAMTFFAVNPGFMRGDFEKPISLSLLSYYNFDELNKISMIFETEMKNSKVFSNVSRNIKTSMPTIEVIVDRDKAAKYGVLLDQIGTTLEYLVAGKRVTQFNIGNEKYDVFMSLPKPEMSKVEDLSKIYVRTIASNMIPLSNVSEIKETVSILEYTHYNTAKSIGIGAELASGYTINDAKTELEKIASKLIDRSKIDLVYKGDIKRMSESNSSMMYTFLLAILFIYLVLAAQFESYTDPLIIILAVPFSITGGVLFLIIFGSSINLYSNIGLITLIGLITKNSILIVEFANQLRISGKNKLDSIIESCELRLRPILMTTSATVLGALPLVIASGASAQSRSSIGLVIFGGMIIGTIFTLFIIPSIYFRFKK